MGLWTGLGLGLWTGIGLGLWTGIGLGLWTGIGLGLWWTGAVGMCFISRRIIGGAGAWFTLIGRCVIIGAGRDGGGLGAGAGDRDPPPPPPNAAAAAAALMAGLSWATPFATVTRAAKTKMRAEKPRPARLQ